MDIYIYIDIDILCCILYDIISETGEIRDKNGNQSPSDLVCFVSEPHVKGYLSPVLHV